MIMQFRMHSEELQGIIASDDSEALEHAPSPTIGSPIVSQIEIRGENAMRDDKILWRSQVMIGLGAFQSHDWRAKSGMIGSASVFGQFPVQK
jgi:hypothetical protein